MKHTTKALAVFLLALAMVIGLLPGLGMTAKADSTHTHDGWTPIASLPKNAGSYYLTQDIELSSAWTVPAGEVNLCLNGKTISGNNVTRVITVGSGSTLNLYDEAGNGKITGGMALSSSSSAPNFESGGGVLVQGNGTFNMYGGTISGNKAQGNGTGAGVYVAKNGTFNMYDGSITDNQAFFGGGVLNHGTFNLKGGSITGNKAVKYSDTDAYGGGVFHCTNGTFTVSGNPQITGNTIGDSTPSNVHLQGYGGGGDIAKITIGEGGLEQDASIGVTMYISGVFTIGSDEELKASDYARNFTSDNVEYTVRAKELELELVGGHTHTVNNEDITFQKWPSLATACGFDPRLRHGKTPREAVSREGFLLFSGDA